MTISCISAYKNDPAIYSIWTVWYLLIYYTYESHYYKRYGQFGRSEVNISWEFEFPGSQYDEEHLCNGTEFSRSNNLKYYVSSCFFLELSPNGAVRINSTSDDVKTYTESNKFDSCSSGSQSGGSLYFSEKGEFIQTKNFYINSTNLFYSPSFYTSVSEKPNYKNHANETIIYNCGSSELECRLTSFMNCGFIIMNPVSYTHLTLPTN